MILLRKGQEEDIIRHRELEMRHRLDIFLSDLAKYNNDSVLIAADLTRVYRSSQESLIHEINSTEAKLAQLVEELDMSRYEVTTLLSDKEAEIVNMNQRIFELKRQLNEMAGEFAHMLQTSANLLREKMAVVSLATSDDSYSEGKRNNFQDRLISERALT